MLSSLIRPTKSIIVRKNFQRLHFRLGLYWKLSERSLKPAVMGRKSPDQLIRNR
ncbi:unnamed protein product, partial [Nesidiocoris tenuis]